MAVTFSYIKPIVLQFKYIFLTIFFQTLMEVKEVSYTNINVSQTNTKF